jgi:hypothetical protein
VIVNDRDFVLALDFAQTDFQQPVRWRRPGVPGQGRPPKRAARPAWTTSDTTGTTGQSAQ